MSSDDHSTCACFLTFLDLVGFDETFPLVSGFQLFSELIVAYTPGVYDRVWRQNILEEEGSSDQYLKHQAF
jgi:hypothetical protein